MDREGSKQERQEGSRSAKDVVLQELYRAQLRQARECEDSNGPDLSLSTRDLEEGKSSLVQS